MKILRKFFKYINDFIYEHDVLMAILATALWVSAATFAIIYGMVYY